MRTVFIVVAGALLLSFATLAQAATLSGVIVDPSGAVLPGVQVQLTSTSQGQQATRTVRTDRVGRYVFDELAAGSYVMKTNLAGFADTERTVQLLDVDTVQDLSLRIGTLQETIHVTAGGTPPPVRYSPPPAAPAPPAPRAAATVGGVRVGGNIKAPTKTASVAPIYPATLAAEKVGGVVILEGTIGMDGIVRDVTTVQSPNDDLTRSASDAFMQWRFTPTLLNGSPIEVRMVGTFFFDAK